ncbi:GPW/gp25 family protein [Shewanella morhuae]|uniref:Gene 25-like lysozyme n=1 Tax=Shewanella morhuae TaxID=365591 RepID=A0A380B6L9_9GAMM|nr:GPW/gp25 family protein [Shewanella morhuae]SUI93659.1 Gene 25-like lysozyme [Shewanella morhuae]SUJ13298.1 Gene 25-like lysozyme [Shewanella morhuae]
MNMKKANWQGMNRFDGRGLSESQHISQSIQDILTTPLGSRVMRRDYGSAIFELIDQPQSAAIKLQIMAAAVIALTRWEPRIRITEIEVVAGDLNGKMQFNLLTDRIDIQRQQSFEATYG